MPRWSCRALARRRLRTGSTPSAASAGAEAGRSSQVRKRDRFATARVPDATANLSRERVVKSATACPSQQFHALRPRRRERDARPSGGVPGTPRDLACLDRSRTRARFARQSPRPPSGFLYSNPTDRLPSASFSPCTRRSRRSVRASVQHAGVPRGVLALDHDVAPPPPEEAGRPEEAAAALRRRDAPVRPVPGPARA